MAPRILIADDDADMRLWLRTTLRAIDAEVTEVASGWQLLDALADGPPLDLVISDVFMPLPNGVSAAAMARAAGMQVPFIILTASLDERVRASAERVADAMLLRKPLSPRELLDCVASRLRPERSDGGEEPDEIATDRSVAGDGRTPIFVRPGVQRILVPVDLSPGSHEALAYAVFLAGRLDAAIDILHVCPPVEEPDSANDRLLGFSRSNQGRMLDEYVAAVQMSGVAEVRARVELGQPADVIIRLTETESYDLVVMAKRSADPARPDLGGLTDSVVRGAACPVVTLHQSIREALAVASTPRPTRAPSDTLQ